jgi:hypothetical protein
MTVPRNSSRLSDTASPLPELKRLAAPVSLLDKIEMISVLKEV